MIERRPPLIARGEFGLTTMDIDEVVEKLKRGVEIYGEMSSDPDPKMAAVSSELMAE